jgi:AcrR family transcriptional regulator
MAEPLTAATILDTAEDVLRRFGPAKASVVDVARALDVSHGSVYRHFASKAALRDAVTQRWLARVSEPLEAIVMRKGKASRKLHDWLVLLATTKQGMATGDPELFETFHELTLQSREVVAAHVDHLSDQLGRIVAQGMEDGDFAPGDPSAVGRAVLNATAKFHHPAHAGEWGDPGLAEQLQAVYRLILNGLAARRSTPSRARPPA